MGSEQDSRANFRSGVQNGTETSWTNQGSLGWNTGDERALYKIETDKTVLIDHCTPTSPATANLRQMSVLSRTPSPSYPK